MASRKKIVQPPAYRDAEFMESVSARPVRLLTEYIDPMVRLRRENVGDTIVIFGSARIHSRASDFAAKGESSVLVIPTTVHEPVISINRTISTLRPDCETAMTSARGPRRPFIWFTSSEASTITAAWPAAFSAMKSGCSA